VARRRSLPERAAAEQTEPEAKPGPTEPDAQPEFRWDTLEGQWRVIAPNRQDRPWLPDDDCPFCPGGLDAPTPYRVRVFTNRWPPLTAGTPGPLDPTKGVAPARGAAEVILYTSDHDNSLGALDFGHLRDVVSAWSERTTVLGSRPEVAYVLCFENRGPEVGATISHPHGQIYGFPFVPPRAQRIFGAATCRVCADLDATPLVVGEDERARCWLASASAWPYGFRLAPRRHLGSLNALTVPEERSWSRLLGRALRALDALWDRPMPYMLDLHQSPTDGKPWPNAHLFLEVACPLRAPGVPRYVAAGEIGSGIFQNPVRPEEAAAALRRVWR
jgi:UDPglucose--hexose-1-phosphate uridylyltransferase